MPPKPARPSQKAKKTAMEHLMSSDEEAIAQDQVQTPEVLAGAEPQALTSGVVSAPGPETPREVVLIDDDPLFREINPLADEYVALAFDAPEFEHSEALAYAPNSNPASSSPERGPDGGALMVVPSDKVNLLVLDASESNPEPVMPAPKEVVRIWRGVEYAHGRVPSAPNVEGVITPENPYGAAPPKKDRELVVHPAVDAHMQQQKEGRKKGLKTLLSEPQCRLLEADFREALEEWDERSHAGDMEMWRALEASRYAVLNPDHDQVRADVNAAVKLLIPLRLVQSGPLSVKQKSWSVAAEKHEEGGEVYCCRFKIIPAPGARAAAVLAEASLETRSQFIQQTPTPPATTPAQAPPPPAVPAANLAAAQPNSGVQFLALSAAASPLTAPVLGHAQVFNAKELQLPYQLKPRVPPAVSNLEVNVNTPPSKAPGKIAGIKTPPLSMLPDDGDGPAVLASRSAAEASLRAAIEKQAALRAKGGSSGMPPPSPRAPSYNGGSAAKAGGGAAAKTTQPQATHLAPRQPPPAVNPAKTKNATTKLMHAAEVQFFNDARMAAAIQRQLDAESDLDHPANHALASNAAPIALTNETNEALILQLEGLRAELQKRGRREVEVPPEPSASDEEIEEDDVWGADRFAFVKEQLLEKHQRSRTHHSSAGPADNNWEEHKYHVLVRHLESCYGERNDKGQIPRNPDQVDLLITAVVMRCGPCTRLRADKTKERQQAETQALRRKQDWSIRYKHRLEADEYESDPNHQADTKCGKCSQPGGRKNKTGRAGAFGDPDDRDQLRNCEGADCTKAFHLDCRGLEQDTPESRRHHGLSPDEPITFARRAEPWLCAQCWSTAGRKQLAHDKALLAQQKLDFANKSKRARTSTPPGGNASATSPVNSPQYDALASPRSASGGSSAEEGGFDPPETDFSLVKLLRSVFGKTLLETGKQQQELTGEILLPKTRSSYPPSDSWFPELPGKHSEGRKAKQNTENEEVEESHTVVLPPSEHQYRPDSGVLAADAKQTNTCAAFTGNEHTHKVKRVQVTVEGRPWRDWQGRSHPAHHLHDATVNPYSKNHNAAQRSERKQQTTELDTQEGREAFAAAWGQKEAEKLMEEGERGSTATGPRNDTFPPNQSLDRDYESGVSFEDEERINAKRAKERGGDHLNRPPAPQEKPAAPSSQWPPLVGPPTPQQLHNGEATEPGPCGETSRDYGKMRRRFLDLLQHETGLPNQRELEKTLNVELEETCNLQAALFSVTNHNKVGLRAITEQLRETLPSATDEDWDRHWVRCQTGYLRSRGEARRAIKGIIAKATGCSESMAAGYFTLVFKEEGDVEGSIATAVREITELQAKEAEATEPPPISEDTAESAAKDLAEAVAKEQADAADYAVWREKYDASTKKREARHEVERQIHDRKLQETEQASQAAKAAAVDALAVVTGRGTEEINRELTAQLERFRTFSDAVRATADRFSASTTASRQAQLPSAIAALEAGSALQSAIPLAEATALFGTDSPVQFGHQIEGFFSNGHPVRNSNFHSERPPLGPPKQQKFEEGLTLRECYAKSLHDESFQDNALRFSVQLDRPLVWVDISADPKYACAGWDVTAYTNWKQHAEKRKAQGAPQRFITYIHIDMLDLICTMLRTAPSHIMSMSDELLLYTLDKKFNIAQETNLLLMQFRMPERPKALPLWELHLPITEWNNYVTRWIKELRNQQEAGKDLDKYDLSEVFAQSVPEFKLVFDHARVLTKLPVRELIASCSDFLQENVISEKKSSNARQQEAKIKGAAAGEGGAAAEPPAKKETAQKGGFTAGNGAFTTKQARAFFTEAAKAMKQNPPPGGKGGASAGGGGAAAGGSSQFSGPLPKEFLVAFVKLSFFDVGCEGCGKWYKNAPDRKFPNPCTGRCQYEGHPHQNLKYKDGVRWKYPGFCCSWKGMQDKDIPSATLSRLQKYSAQKRERDPSA